MISLCEIEPLLFIFIYSLKPTFIHKFFHFKSYISFHLFSFLGGDSSLEIQDLKSQLEECEGRLEKGAEYVDYLQAQQEEMTAEIEMLKKAEEVCTVKIRTYF